MAADWRSIHLQLFAEEGERREPATPKRRREARRRGQVLRSAELSTATILMAGLAVLWFGGGNSLRAIMGLFSEAYGQWLTGDWTAAEALAWFRAAMGAWFLAVGPVMAALVVAGLGVNLAQVGPLLTLEPLAPKWERINPLEGAKRVFSRRALFEFGKSMVRLLVVGFVTYRGIQAALVRLMGSVGDELTPQVSMLAQDVMGIALQAAVVILVLAVFDYMYQRYEHERRLMMSHKQVRDEHKETEGDPNLRARLRARQRELSRNRMLTEVARADVVITNPTHYAVALCYDPDAMAAPLVVAKGVDHLALQIRRLAREHGVVRVEEPALARALYRDVEVGGAVPENLYEAVAEVIAFVWRLKGRRSLD